jgi:hypothetical protein
MRNLALAILALATVSVTGPATAQTYDPSYPVCLQYYGPISYYDCRYTSLAQCAAAASGRPASCSTNPYFASATAGPGRRQRHAY